MGLFDKVCSAETHLAHPGLYATKSNGESFFNIKVSTYLCDEFTIRYFREKEKETRCSCLHPGILDMDRECADSLVVALLVTVAGPQTGRGLGKRQRWRLPSIRKLCVYRE